MHSLFSIAILLMMATVISINSFRGLTKGLASALLSFGALLLSILAAAALSPYLAEWLVAPFFYGVSFLIDLLDQIPALLARYAGWLSEDTLSNISYNLSMAKDALATVDLSSIPNYLMVKGLISTLVSAVVFLLLLFPLRGLFSLGLHLAFRKELAVSQADPQAYLGQKFPLLRHRTLLGGIVGGLTGLVLCMALTAPLMGALRTFIQLGDMFSDPQKTYESIGITQEGLSILTACGNDFFGNLLYTFGGKAIFNIITRADWGEGMVYLCNNQDQLVWLIEDLTGQYSTTVSFLLSPIVNCVSCALILIFAPIAYVFVTARLLPRLLLTPKARADEVSDRGLRRYTFQDGRAIVYQPAPAHRQYIRQYILSEHNGTRFLQCQTDERIFSIKYRILPFDEQDRPLDILDVEDPIFNTDNGKPRPVPLPPRTAYVSVEVQAVNDVNVYDSTQAGFSLKSTAIYGAAVAVLTMALALVIMSLLVFYTNLIFAAWGTATLRFGKLFFPSMGLGLAYAILVFGHRFFRERRFYS